MQNTSNLQPGFILLHAVTIKPQSRQNGIGSLCNTCSRCALPVSHYINQFLGTSHISMGRDIGLQATFFNIDMRKMLYILDNRGGKVRRQATAPIFCVISNSTIYLGLSFPLLPNLMTHPWMVKPSRTPNLPSKIRGLFLSCPHNYSVCFELPKVCPV